MSDTSRPQNKNPLLSASVTGLTFDDFTNKAILLPAAALPPKLPDNTNIKDTEFKNPVIFGSEPAVLDTESFSEISLDRSSDLEPNPLEDDQFTTENSRTFNPLTQATHLTASLSQLPSVASSVFSSFSNILRGNSPTPTAIEHQQQIEYNNFLPAPQLDEFPPTDNSNYHQVENAAVPVPVPVFYSPDSAFLPSAPAKSPPLLNTSSGNAYRLTTKKKLYAPAPGLIPTQDAPAIPTSSFPSYVPPVPQQIIEPQLPVNQLSAHQAAAASQSASQGNKFSLTSFFSTPILDKSQLQESQPIVSSDIFAAQSTPATPATPANFVNPSLFNTNPVASANIQSQNIYGAYSPEQQQQQQQQQPVTNFFNPNQSAAFYSGQSNEVKPNFHTAVEPPIENIFPSPSASVPTVPPSSGNISNYRLRGKPHYKIPATSTAANPTLVIPFSQGLLNTTPSVEIFTPVQSEIVADRQSQVINPTLNSTQSTESTAPFQITQQLPPTTDLFKQRQSPDLSLNSQNPNYQLSQLTTPPSTQLYWNNSGSIGLERETTFIDPVTQSNQFQQLSQVQQPDQLQQTGLHQHFGQLEQFGPAQEQGRFQQTDQLQQPSPVQPPSEVQHPSQFLHCQVEQLSLVQEPPQFQQSDQLQPIPQVLQKTDQLSQLQQGSSENLPYFTPYSVTAYASNVEELSLHQQTETDLPSGTSAVSRSPHQISNPESSELNQYVTPVDSSEFACLERNQQEQTELNPNIAESNASQFYDYMQPQHNVNANFDILVQPKNVATFENTNPTNFDNFFDQKAHSGQNFNYSEAEKQQNFFDTPSSVGTFFDTSSNSLQPDWFNPQRTTEFAANQNQIIESDVNSNIQTPPDAETIKNLINTNNKQTSPNSSQPNYFQIQNFFNNPPLIADRKEQDINFNFIENNLINKRLHNLTHKTSIETDGGSISSNIVEPPSSAQSELSEFAEINTETTTQSDDFISEEQISANSRNASATMTNVTDQSNGAACSTAPEISNVAYRPVYKHWFFSKTTSDQKTSWIPFPMDDSLHLEEALITKTNEFITTNGGRYDVNIELRQRSPIYWNGSSDEVRRCSWFYKGTDSRLVPYDENVSDLLEEEYKAASQTGEWNRKVVIPCGDVVVFQAPSVIVHFLATQSPDTWPNTSIPQPANRPRVVKRGVDEFNIEDGESEQVDHLLFMVHGIGAGCDLKFRSVEEVVEDFRAIALQLTQSHYRSSCDRGEVGRIEILPVSWHAELHSEESGIDEKLRAITLESIPKLRTFTNDTLLDILFYSSPVFCQKIMDTVAGTINRMYTKYCEKNPSFKGNVSLAGHSLGSLILFDLLQNQRDSQLFDMDIDRTETTENSEETGGVRSHKPLARTRSRKINYTVGIAGTGQPFINYPQLVFKPKKFFALGSPIGMFVTIRGVDNLGLNYKLPTTDGFYNIFHPYDPVAYRIEALVNSELISARPVLIPHHKGRKRMHLELRETMARVGADIKQKIVDTFKSVYNFASLQKTDPKSLELEVNKVLEQQLALDSPQSQRTRANSSSTTYSDIDNGDTEFSLGVLNEGKRIDYVLQEAPLEFFNEYLFALTSHVCYWDSADTILFIVKEIYSLLGMQTDGQIPQQSMTIERPISTSPPAPLDS